MNKTATHEKITLRYNTLRRLCRRDGMTDARLSRLSLTDYYPFDISSQKEFTHLIRASIDLLASSQQKELASAALNVKQESDTTLRDRMLSVFPEGSISLKTAERRRDSYMLLLAELTLEVQADDTVAAATHEERIRVLESLVLQLVSHQHGKSTAEDIIERVRREVQRK